MVISSFLKKYSPTFYRTEILIWSKRKHKFYTFDFWLTSLGMEPSKRARQQSSGSWTKRLGFKSLLSYLVPQWLWASDLTSLCLFHHKFVVGTTENHAHNGQEAQGLINIGYNYWQEFYKRESIHFGWKQ